jgi:putative thioredoxin
MAPQSLSPLSHPSDLLPVAAKDSFVKDVTLQTFVADVIEGSKVRPVIVDFWAPWCGPCKQLGPILEKLVRAAKGALLLVKIDIDRDPEISQQMGVQSIPAVFAFFQGRPVDGFMGALPESEIQTWIDRLLKLSGGVIPPEADDVVNLNLALDQAAEFLAAQDFATAEAIYRDVLDQDAANPGAYIGLIRCRVLAGDLKDARQFLDNAPAAIAKDKALDAVRTVVELAEQAAQGGSVNDLEAKVQANPADHQARFDLAMAHYAVGQREQAVDALLEIVRRDRKWNEDAARKQLVKLFEAFGAMDPLTIAARRRLSSIMFS